MIGDIGIHEKCGNTFWEEVASGICEKLAEDRFTEAVVSAIQKVEKTLTHHFPRQPDDRDELPNDVLRD